MPSSKAVTINPRKRVKPRSYAETRSCMEVVVSYGWAAGAVESCHGYLAVQVVISQDLNDLPISFCPD